MRRFFSVLAVLLVAACGGEAPRLNVGDTAPAFTATTLAGARVAFPADFRGRPLVLRFWADWCRYCEGEMKAIERVRKRRPGLAVLAVNVGQGRDHVAAFVEKTAIGYPALMDEDAAIARRYGVVGLPTTFFIGADGRIRAKVVGEADEATFDRLAGELLQ